VILIGQYDSPFVRRVAVALTTYGVAFEHRDWSGFGDVDKIAGHNPLRRVPTLVLRDGRAVVDSATILEFIDDVVGHERATLARNGADRLECLRLAAFAAGVADKGVSLVYEGAFREGLPMWVARCTAQIDDTLDLLDAERAARPGVWLFGDMLSHADVMLATMYKFIEESLPGSFDLKRRDALTRHSASCEALPLFQGVYRPYTLTRPSDTA
jgi:glutathione S-transferase